jgi:hypothetical protein
MDDLHLSHSYPSSAAKPEQKPEQRTGQKSGQRWLWLLVLLLVVFIAGLLGNPWFEAQTRHLLPAALQTGQASTSGAQDLTQQAAIVARLTALEQKTAIPGGDTTQLGARVAALEAQKAAPGGQAVDLTLLEQRLMRTEERLTAFESQQKALESQLAGLQNQGALLASLQAAVLGLNNQVGRELAQARASIGIVSLRRALDEGRPYAQQLDSVSPVVLPTDPDLIVLRRFAASGIPNIFMLRQRFANLLPQVQHAARQTGTSGNWIDNALAQMRDLVSVKTPDSPQKPSTLEATLASMRQNVEQGNFAAAQGLARRLPGDTQALLEPWIQQINQRQAVLAAFDRVEAQILSPRALPTLNLSPAPLPSPVSGPISGPTSGLTPSAPLPTPTKP